MSNETEAFHSEEVFSFAVLYQKLRSTNEGWMCRDNERSSRPGKKILESCGWSSRPVSDLVNFVDDLCSRTEAPSTKVNWTLWCKTMIVEGVRNGSFVLPEGWDIVTHKNRKSELWVNGKRLVPPLGTIGIIPAPSEPKLPQRPLAVGQLSGLVSSLQDMARLQCRKMQLEAELMGVNRRMKETSKGVPQDAKKVLRWLVASYPTLRPVLGI